MAVPKSIHDAKGSWRGKSKLNLADQPPDKRVTESDSHLHVDCDALNAYATILYDWSYEGKRQEGTMLLCMAHKAKTVEYGWVDSWHQSTAVMHLAGTCDDTGPVKAKGTWSAGGQPWGWTISLEHMGDELLLKMEVITPDGRVEWAVDATYKRE
jgi:hypothetical protein